MFSPLEPMVLISISSYFMTLEYNSLALKTQQNKSGTQRNTKYKNLG